MGCANSNIKPTPIETCITEVQTDTITGEIGPWLVCSLGTNGPERVIPFRSNYFCYSAEDWTHLVKSGRIRP